ncbi:MAG: aspartate/glutamate/uridylate kinase [Rhodocyclaceae bacterium]|nr:aspartate/glutamate/uridylate kinase [Rhodocyclaceae bacterium]
MWALKVGGSILHAPPDDPLAAARDALFDRLRAEPGRFLLVPGGGHHADAVRAAQQAEGFDDDTAHVRALAAMDVCARELADLLGDTARVVTRIADAPAIAASGGTPVWAPHTDLAHDHSLPRSWALTSDSIAAVAVRRLGLAGVCLLKSCEIPPGASAQALAAAGIVDSEWPRQALDLTTVVLHLADFARAGVDALNPWA